jgi:hypothetical protein
MSLTGLDTLPPIVIALIAILSGVVWHVAGALALFRLTPRSLDESLRLTLAWFLWLPLSGAAVLGLVLAGAAGRAPLVAGTVLVGSLALLSLPILKNAVTRARSSWARWWREATSTERWLLRAGVALQLVLWAFAGHPQRQIDQFNYHLVVGHLVVRDGEPFTGTMDPHVSFAGAVEYGLAWHQAWTHSTLLFVGMAQVAIMLATVPVIVLCGLRLGGGSVALLGTLLLTVPAIIPESDMMRMAKPDGVVLAGVVLALTLVVECAGDATILVLALLAVLLACKVTALHAGLGLLLALLVQARPLRPALRAWPLLAVGVAALALQGIKNGMRLGDPVYPAAADFFHAIPWDETARAYWNDVAFAGHPRWSGLLGPLVFIRRAAPLVSGIALATILLWRSRGERRTVSRAEPQARLFLGPTCFVLATCVTWPFFYGGWISPRFLSGLSGGVLVLWLLLLAKLDRRSRRVVQVASSLAAVLLASELDVSAPHLRVWNRGSAFEALAGQWPRLRTAAALHAELGATDAVIADQPEKLFFEALVISPTPYSPRERAVVEELARRPAEVARRLHLKALIVNGTKPLSPGMAAAWSALEPYGTVREIGADRILWSPSRFQSR